MLIYFLLFTLLIFCFIIFVCLDWQNKRKNIDDKHHYYIIVDEKELLIEMFTDKVYQESDFEKVKDEIAEKFDCNKDEIGIFYYGKNSENFQK